MDFSKIFDPNNLAAVLVLAGLGFLLLAIVGEIQGKVKVPPERQKLAGGIGVVLLVAGLVLYTTRTSQPTVTNVVATPNVVTTASPLPTTAGSIASNNTNPDPVALLNTTKTWPIVVEDTFDDNTYYWPIGTFSWDRGKQQTSINGKFRVELESKGDWIKWLYPIGVDPIENFYLSVEGRLIKGSTDSEYGVAFRADADRCYFATIVDDKYFDFFIYDNKSFRLLGRRQVTVLKPGQENQIAVVVQKSHFVFYINGKYVAEADDDRLKSGYAGVYMYLPNKGEQGIFEFDNFQLRRKP